MLFTTLDNHQEEPYFTLRGYSLLPTLTVNRATASHRAQMTDFALFHHAHYDSTMQVYQYSANHWVVRMDKGESKDFFLWTHDRATATIECTHSSTHQVVARLRHNTLTFHFDPCLLSRKYVDVLTASIFFLRQGLQLDSSSEDDSDVEDALFV
jgi:hypothetical protein